MATPRARSEPPLVVIVGPTASGKTALAIEIAEVCQGEIIAADSRTIYKEMDIGTAKPSLDEQRRVPHFGINLVAPGESFSAADFKAYANQKIQEIRQRGHTPILVGGTGLYVDGVIFDYTFGPKADPRRRQELEAMSAEQLYQYCIDNNVMLPENYKNKRYVVRAIEQNKAEIKKQQIPIENTIIVGITTDKTILRTRIEARTEQLFENGVVDEATMLGKKYGWDNEAMTGNIYPLVHSYLKGEQNLAQIKEKFTTLDWRLAKRQLTWLGRNPYIHWLSLTEAKDYLTGRLVNG